MKRRRRNQKKERIIMLMSSLFVLTALTMTGVYVKERNKVNKDYVVDLSGLQQTEGDMGNSAENPDSELGDSAQVSSRKVENPTMVKKEGEETEAMFPWEMAAAEESSTPTKEPSKAVEEQEKARELKFGEKETLVWPVVGNVLINYSMDKPVYFASLEQYKVNPGIVIQATEGQQISAAATGRVSKIAKEEETGNTIYMDIGSGYQVVYGQLTNIQVKEGDLVEKGTYLADVAAPTKYYSVEGCNVYFALSKNGTPVDPMGKLK